MKLKPSFKNNLLCIAISLALNSMSSQASVVRGDVDYQYYRDFAENKGKFVPGATAIEIFDKNGKSLGPVLHNDIPMPDFQASSRGNGVATLVSAQYILSVAHNIGYGSVQFGAEGNNPDAHYFDYLIVDRNNFAATHNRNVDDYQQPRLHKLVTEVIPIETSPEIQASILKDHKRFPAFVRRGSGVQYVSKSINSAEKTWVETAGKYLTGGATPDWGHLRDDNNIVRMEGFLYTSDNPRATARQSPLMTSAHSGDSGSGMYVYDAQDKKWLFAGVLQASAELRTHIDHAYVVDDFVLYRDDFYRTTTKDDNVRPITNTVKNPTYTWTSNGKTSTITGDGLSRSVTVNLRDSSLSDTDKERPSLNNGKNLYIYTALDTHINLKLANSIDQGAGALFLGSDVTVSSDNPDTTYLGAGVDVAQGNTVTWKIKNPENDRLSKTGQGTLIVNGTGVNKGSISVGDGTVILRQQADSAGKKSAFSELGIVSGRPTVVLEDAQQVDPDKIYFGFHGGRLDLNGNDLTFKRIQNVDEGARIVNHNTTRASTLTILGDPTAKFTVFSGSFGEVNTCKLTICDASEKRNTTPSSQNNSVNSTDNNEVLETENNTSINNASVSPRGVETILFKRSADGNELASTGSASSTSASTATEASSGSRGDSSGDSSASTGTTTSETTTNSHPTNGELNVKFTPTIKDATMLISADMNLNGTFTLENGNLVLSGIPTPHAYDALAQKEVIKEDDWINRDFNARTFIVGNDTKLFVGRNVNQVNSDFDVKNNGKVYLGFLQQTTPECIRNSQNGSISCSTDTLSDNAFNSMPQTVVTGNSQLSDNSQLNLGKTTLLGTVQGETSSSMSLSKDSQWVMTADSTIGSLSLTNGSSIQLNKDLSNASKFNTLTINGNLAGAGLFKYTANGAQKLNDKVVVNGQATGSYQLLVQDNGGEPYHKESLDLLILNGNQNTDNLQVSLGNLNQEVHLGNYIYRLTKNGNSYSLYSPTLIQKILADEKAVADARRQAQRDYISKYPNTALSDIAAQMNVLNMMNQKLAYQVLSANVVLPSLSVWAGSDAHQARYGSSQYRDYQQKSQLYQVGIDGAIPEKHLALGAVLTRANSTADFSNNISGKTKAYNLGLYTKYQADNGVFVGVDGQFGQSTSHLTINNVTKVKRHFHGLGLNTGVDFSRYGIHIQPSIGGSYQHLNSASYNLDGAEVYSPKVKLVTAHTGVKVSRSFNVNGIKFNPSLASYYSRPISGDKHTTVVNGEGFNQQFEPAMHYEAGLGVKLINWEISANYGVSRGSNSLENKIAGIKVDYRW